MHDLCEIFFVQIELRSSKSSVWAGVEGTVASDLVSTLSFILGTQPRVIAGMQSQVSAGYYVSQCNSIHVAQGDVTNTA